MNVGGGWEEEQDRENKKKEVMHILSSRDAFICPLFPAEYLEEQPYVFLDSWKTSGFGSF